MKLSKFETALICGLARTIDEWAAEELPNTRELIGRSAWAGYRDRKHEVDLAREQIASLDLKEFLQIEPSPSEFSAACKAWKRLESIGLVVRLSGRWSDRTSQIQLTSLGREWVNAHLAASAA